MRSQTVHILLPTGNPNGLRIADIATRTVRVFDVPRKHFGQFMRHPESQQAGVYYLLGDDDQAYVGESGSVGLRLKQHMAEGKATNFWNRAMVAVSKSGDWSPTHTKVIEWLSITRGRATGRYSLINDRQWAKPEMPDMVESDCHEFMDTITTLLITLGVPIIASAGLRGAAEALPGGSAAATTDESPPKLLTVPQAAEAMQVSRMTIYRMFQAGDLRWVQVGGRRRIPYSELVRVLNDSTPASRGLSRAL